MEMIKPIEQLKQGLSTAFINQNISSNLAYKPQFVSNNYYYGFTTKDERKMEWVRLLHFFDGKNIRVI